MTKAEQRAFEGYGGFNFQTTVPNDDCFLTVPINNKTLRLLLQLKDGDNVKITIEKI